MADVTYSQLAAADPLTGTEEFGVEQTATTKKATPLNVETLLVTRGTFATAAQGVTANDTEMLLWQGI